MLWIGHRAFQVDASRARLRAYITQPEELRWELSLACLAAPHDGLSTPWQPRLYLDTMRLPVRDWRRLEGMALDFGDRDEDDEFVAGIYQDIHSPLLRNRIRFPARSGDRFRVEWDCLSAVDCFDVGVASPPVRVETDVRFVGAWVSRDDASERTVPAVQALLAGYLDLSALGDPEVEPGSRTWFPPRLPAEQDLA